MTPEEQTRRLQRTCQQVIVQRAAAKPLCLLVEDVQWLDSGSQELLDLLVAGLARLPILLLSTARPGCRHLWRDQRGVHKLTMTPLTGDHTDAFVHHWCWPHDASTGLKALIRERTEGNPFFIEEMLRALQEHQLLAVQNGQYVVRTGKDVEIPASVQGVLAARIDRLEADLKEVVQVAAVIGREFPLWLLEAVLGRTDLREKLAILGQLALIYAKASAARTDVCLQTRVDAGCGLCKPVKPGKETAAWCDRRGVRGPLSPNTLTSRCTCCTTISGWLNTG